MSSTLALGSRRLLFGVTVVLLYVVSYLILTLGGAYAPSTYGLRVDKDGKTISAPKWYSWAPMGFAGEHDHWSMMVALFYCPLYVADRTWWHTDDRQFSGNYPIHLHPADIP